MPIIFEKDSMFERIAKCMRRVLFCIFTCNLLTAPAFAAGLNDFIISYWAGPPSGGNYDAQYAEVAECNFTHAMYPVNGGSPEQNKAILDACEKHGLKYIPYDGRVLSKAPGDPQFAANLDAIIADYANHPALAGYFLADEPGPGAFPLLAAVNQYLLKKDPARLPFINMLPNYVDEKYIGGPYEKFLEQYCATVKPKLLCYDHYALFEKVERESYFANMEAIRRNALKCGAAMGYIFQCTPHGTYRDPSETDLRWQVNTALAYGCKALLYFTYFTPTDADSNFHNGILDAKGNRTPHFAMAKAINAELKNLSGTLTKLTSTSVYHTGPLPAGCTALAADAPIQVQSGGPLVLGFFKHEDRSNWAIVVNRDMHKPTSASLVFAGKPKGVDELSPQTGKLAAIQLADGKATFELARGGIKLFKLQAARRPRVKVIDNGESVAKPDDCRGVVVGPGVNQPDAFPGYAGFVGWDSPIRLKNGEWLVGFSAGYWHASPPTPLRYPRAALENYRKMGMPDIAAPTGGRAMIVRSKDDGKTWSKPETLIDTPADDRHPAFIQADDGTIVCSFFTYVGQPENDDYNKTPDLGCRVCTVRSFDNGHTWEKEPHKLPTPFMSEETDGPFTRLNDGSLLIAIDGRPKTGPPDQAAFFRSTDRGAKWNLLSTVHADHDLWEVTATQLNDGRLVMMARPEGDISWSSDMGRTWTPLVTFGMRIFAPSLYVLRDGTLVCLHGSYAPGHPGLRVIFSTDGGETWIAPAPDYGFLVDNSYGYGKAMELPDGSLFISHIATGGHSTADAKSNAVRAIRMRVRSDHSGIDLLPAPNR
jgi:hypothetical protein